jgi:hypothetical protein
VERGGMPPDRVWIVRSVPDVGRFTQVKPEPSVRRAFRYLVGYMGCLQGRSRNRNTSPGLLFPNALEERLLGLSISARNLAVATR